MGFNVAAISKGKDKEPLAKKLGTHLYINADDVAIRRRGWLAVGGARVILATAPSGKSMTALVNGLGRRGEIIVLGAAMDPISKSMPSR